MKILQIIFGLVVTLIVIGFIIGFSKKEEMECTLMECICQPNSNLEMPCNTCESRDPVFVLGSLNFVKTCSFTEIVQCQNGVRAGTTYERKVPCNYQVSV